jgi:hypothetical protein
VGSPVCLSRSRVLTKFFPPSFSPPRKAVLRSLQHGVCLVGIVTMVQDKPKMILNPGKDYVMKDDDTCLYISKWVTRYRTLSHTLTHTHTRTRTHALLTTLP